MAIVVYLAAAAEDAVAESRNFRLAMPEELVQSGLPKYMLPRFSLKTQVRIEVVAPGAPAEAEIAPSGAGHPVFDGLGKTWRLRVAARDHAGVQRFSDWISSEVGQRTITGFKVDGAQPFDLPSAQEVEVAAIALDGDAAKGERAARGKCSRCHVVAADLRMSTIGSTPSFFVLRALEDWQNRFEAFYTLNPHPAFTQVAGVSPPFSPERPPPIEPLRLTMTDLENIMAYVAALPPADLGAPLRHQ